MTIWQAGTSAPELTYSAMRNWDFGSGGSIGDQAIVKNIATGPGSYTWAPLDAFVNASVGKGMIFCLGQPADWMIPGRSALGGASKGGKANMCPTGSTELSNYTTAIAAIVQRVKDVHGRTGVRWELWNEFNDSKYYADVYSSLGPYTKAVVEAIKAVDPTAKIMTPSTSYNLFSTQDIQTGYLVTSDGAGGKAGQYCNELSIHYYNDPRDLSTDTPYRMFSYVQSARNSLGLAGMSMPVYVTESGWLADDDVDTYKTKLARRMIVFAALGCKGIVGYAANLNFGGAISLNDARIAPTWNAWAARLAGSTISRLVRNRDGGVEVDINGQTFVV
jgi:hypothetical protein